MSTDLSQLPQLVEALSTVASVLEQLGVPGLLGLVIAGPAAVIVVLIFINHANSKNLSAMLETYRADMQAERGEIALLVERNRADMQTIVRDLGSKHAEVVQYYRDNADLVRDYERMADALQELVVNNTRALERLTVILEDRRKL